MRGNVVDAQGGALPGATVDRAQPGHRHVPRDRQQRRRHLLRRRHRAGRVRDHAPSCRASRSWACKDIRLEIGKTATLDIAARRRRHRGSRHRVGRVAARRRHDRRKSAATSPAASSSTCRRSTATSSASSACCPGIVPSISTESFGSRLDLGQRRRSAQQQLHARRRQQQRRRHRPARGDAGADRDRSRCRNSRSSPTSSTPQFGRTTGAIINAVTKSGTNMFRGSAFVFGQDAAWTAKDYFAKKSNLSEARHPAAASAAARIGGPIVKDKAHFFGSLERVMIDRGTAIIIPARPDFNWSHDVTEIAGLEHDRALRPPGQRQPHLGRPLAARSVAAAQPDRSRRRRSTPPRSPMRAKRTTWIRRSSRRSTPCSATRR